MPAAALTRAQIRRLDHALKRRQDGHESVESGWASVIAEIIGSGAPVKAVAQHLGVSRQAVYDWLKRAEGV